MTEVDFKARVLPHAGRMYAIAVTILNNAEDAKDCVQECLARLWNVRGTLADIDNVGAYCFVAVRRAALDTWRKEHRKALWDDRILSELTDEGYSESRIEGRDRLKNVKDLIDELPEQQRKVLLLSGVSGLSNPEIEEVTGLSPENVRSLLCRARKRLRQLELNMHQKEQCISSAVSSSE